MRHIGEDERQLLSTCGLVGGDTLADRLRAANESKWPSISYEFCPFWNQRLGLLISRSHVAVYLHGMAGDLAESDKGEVSMTAADVAAHIGEAILELTGRRKVVEKT